MRASDFLCMALALGLSGTAVLAEETRYSPPPAPRPIEGGGTGVSETASRQPAASSAPAHHASSQLEKAQAAPQPPRFIASASPREPRTGYSLGVFGGVNAFQSIDTFVNGASVNEGTSVDGVGGIKFGYTWTFSDEPIQQFKDIVRGEGLRLSGGLEGELFWLGNRISLNGANGSDKVDLDSMVFMMNFLLKGQSGKYRPYLGVGVGGAAMFAHHDLDSPSDEQVSLAYQFLVGCDYFIKPDWSVFADMRYLCIEGSNPTFFEGPSELEIRDLDQGIFNVGVKKHF